MPACEIDRRFHDRIGQVGNLSHDGFHRLVTHDVAIRDAQRFAAFEPAERGQHFRVIAKRANFVEQLLDEGRTRYGLAFGHPQQVVGFVVGNQQVAKVLASREDLQQIGQGIGIAFEERGRSHRIARGGDEALQVIHRHIRIGEGRRRGGELFANLREQVERNAVVGHPHEVGARGRQIGHTERS